MKFWAYIFLFITALSLSGMSILRKRYQKDSTDNYNSTLFFVGVYSGIVLLLGLLYFSVVGFKSFQEIDLVVLLLGFLLACTITITTIICIIGTAYGNVTVLVMFATLGSLVLSSVYGLIVDPVRNKLNVWNIIAFIIVFVIVALNYVSEDKGENARGHKNKIIYRLLCIIVFFTNGAALVVYSALTTFKPTVNGFSFICLYSAFILCICAFLIGIAFLGKKKKETAEAIKTSCNWKTFVNITLYTGFFVLGEVLSIKCTEMIPVIIQAPLSFAFEVLVLTAMDYLAFKEKLSKVNVYQVILAVASGVLFAL